MKPSRSGFPQLNKEKAGAKGGTGFGNQDILEEIFPAGNPDNFDVAVNMTPQDGDNKGASSGPVNHYSLPGVDKDDRIAPQKGDDTPGGGW